VVSLKFKAHVTPRRYPKTGRRPLAKAAPVKAEEPTVTKTYLATIDITAGETFSIPAGMDVESAAAELQKASFRASEEARKIAEGAPPQPQPPRVVRDWLWCDGGPDVGLPK
jgi:hypothetical protein